MKLKQLLELEVEIVGAAVENVKIPGILNEDVSMRIKYWLHKLSKKFETERELYIKARTELIKELGEEDENGGSKIDPKIEKDGKLIDNPKFISFIEQNNDLLNEEVDIKLPVFKIQEFDFKSQYHYPTFFDLLVEEEKESV